MSKIAISGNATGTGVFTLASPATNTDRTLTLPDEAGTVLTTAGVPASAMPAGSVLQVVSTTKDDVYSQTSDSFTQVTGLTATITPSASSSKVLILVGIMASYDDGGTTSRRAAFSIFKGATNLIVPASAGSRVGAMVEITENVVLYGSRNIGYSFLDSPSTTSATTYSVYAKNHGGSPSVLYVNRASNDEDSNIIARGNSTITLMEIAG